MNICILVLLNQTFNENTLNSSFKILFKGKLEPIDLRTATRSGNKKVTLITNLEIFGIDPNRFAHKCQVMDNLEF